MGLYITPPRLVPPSPLPLPYPPVALFLHLGNTGNFRVDAEVYEHLGASKLFDTMTMQQDEVRLRSLPHWHGGYSGSCGTCGSQ